MWASLVVYFGLALAAAACVLAVRPVPRLGVSTRQAALRLTAIGLGLAALGFVLPAPDSRTPRPALSKLDEFMPLWQFDERHTRWIDAPPSRVHDAIRRVRADDIALFRILTWIRRGGRAAPPSILNAGGDRPILEVALSSGFILLADNPPEEVVIATALIAPPGTKGPLTAAAFGRQLPPGIALGAMNFRVVADGGGSLLSTETRVYASSADARRRFAVYWRLIYPGSAIIRRMWLRAIEKETMSAARQGRRL
jgi:hypothetical protein